MFSRKRIGTVVALAAGTAVILSGCSGGQQSEPAATYDPEDEVILNFAFWGNDVRAGLYNDAVDAFNEEFPNITINSQFLTFPEFWEKRQTEAAGGNLPDVMQFDYSYLRQYSENGLLLDLDPYLGTIIDTEPLEQNILDIGVVGDATTALPVSTNAWGFYQNPRLLEEVGVEPFDGGSWEDYQDFMAEVTDSSQQRGLELWGGTDYTGRIQNFEIQLRAQGGELFTEDGEPGFDEDELAEFWESGQPIRDGDGIPQQRVAELNPLGPFDAAKTTAEATWDNFGAGYLANLGDGYTELLLNEPPVSVEGAKDLYLKPAMLHAIAATTEHPEAAATFVDFLVNSPQVGEIFGTNRGLPASRTQLSGAELDSLGAQIAEYEESISDRLGEAPPAPIVGFGSLEEKFRQLGEELGYGTITPDEAASQFFTEMDVILNQ